MNIGEAGDALVRMLADGEGFVGAATAGDTIRIYVESGDSPVVSRIADECGTYHGGYGFQGRRVEIVVSPS